MSSSKVRVVVADDEPLARERIRRLLRKQPEILLVGDARSGPEALELVRNCSPDVLLLDIRLPGLDGFEVLRSLKGTPLPAVIFVTAHSKHALEAFGAGAVDYLVKPFEPHRLRQALHRARTRGSDSFSLVARIAQEAALRPSPQETIAIRTGGRTVLLNLSQIGHILSDNDSSHLRAENQSWRANESLGELARRLPMDRFVRVSRFAIINLDHIRSIRTKSHGDRIAELLDGTEITVARTCRAKLLNRLHSPSGDGDRVAR